ncbi:alpha/beta hydrolase family protein [Flammeovirga aprica]|uniref:Prolyl oligopeptidase family serine peptidase n=1 Tax=Flammeovirga aprica JL-4 TaxID=694437 RepID=A0A7X9RTN3_9BACT|nr:acetylxylan esterase [Flammeovirga aprica]NME68730.1 prolyl oligopeptidase family serine peptidase [Flammeovirga aprica JL-4]
MKYLLILLLCSPIFLFAQKKKSTWDLEQLFKAPKWEKTEIAQVEGMQSIFYEGIPYKGNPTKVYAYYSYPKTPKPEGGYPAVVLVHGGGGTGYPAWVKKWNEQGFVAISMDLEGHIPSNKKHDERDTFIGSGPQRKGVFHDYDLPLQDQWYYQAVAQVILGHSLLRSFEGVNPNKTGITGISWGGMLTSSISGIDDRFQFAVPIYGCGYLKDTDGHMGRALASDNVAYLENAMTYFEASVYLPQTQMPILFVNGTNDAHFPLPATIQSKKAVKGEAFLYLENGLKHGHGSGWNVKESYAFADQVINGAPHFAQLTAPKVKKGKVSISILNNINIKEIQLFYSTYESSEWLKKEWNTETVEWKGKKIHHLLPENTYAAYFQITTEEGISTSSETIILSKKQL